MLTLRIVRQPSTTPVSTEFQVTVDSPDAASQHLEYYRDETDRISAYLFNGDQYLGSGIAGDGLCNSSW